ncbi:MAG TPA: hypothetical protein VM871_09810 [Flavisolibacter sp.]|nr:hypothetical protein [Flavisolibacter sp.]
MSTPLQKKLFHFEAPPPPAMWERIAEDLDTSSEFFPQRLYAYEVQPPTGRWKKIEASLDGRASSARVISFFSRYNAPLRYIAAASVIAIILLAATFTFRQTKYEDVTVNNEILTPAERLETKPSDSDLAGVEREQKKMNRQNSKPPLVSISILKRTLASVRPQNILPSLRLSRSFIPRQANGKTVLPFSSQDNFMVYSDEEGHAMKLPKKLFSLVNCPDGDRSCSERIRQLQRKLATSTAPADFMGMLDLVRQLQ